MTQETKVTQEIAIARALDATGLLGSSDRTDVADFERELLSQGYQVRLASTEAADALLREALEVIRENNPEEYLVQGGETWGLHDDLIDRIDTHLQRSKP